MSSIGERRPAAQGTEGRDDEGREDKGRDDRGRDDQGQDDEGRDNAATSRAHQPGTLRERILDRALERFNAEGIEYVGVRELAKELGIQGGHITYYFPTKDDLVAALGLRLRELNDATIRIPERPSLLAYMRMFRQAFENHHRFRALFMSMPHLMAHNPRLAGSYIGGVEKGRRRVIGDYLRALRAQGVLRPGVSDPEIERIVGFLGLATRGWIGDASISFPDRTPEWSMAYYLRIVADHLRGFAAAKGKRELAQFERELEGAGVPG